MMSAEVDAGADDAKVLNYTFFKISVRVWKNANIYTFTVMIVQTMVTNHLYLIDQF